MQRRAAVRFAHKPIDDAHRNRLLRVRGWWLCRGCTLLYATALLAMAVAPWLVPPLLVAALVLLLAALLSRPQWYGRLPDGARDGVRAASGAAVVWCVLGASRAGNWVDSLIVAWAVVVLAVLVSRSRRRRPVRR
ncbi:MAG: hypothetical protein AB7W59_01440 [Acidimicrobiia bacterium]